MLVRGLVGDPQGQHLLRARVHDPIYLAEELGRLAARDLLNQGAAQLLQL